MLYGTVIEICLVERFYCIMSNTELKHSQQLRLKSIPLRFLFLWLIHTHALEVFLKSTKKLIGLFLSGPLI